MANVVFQDDGLTDEQKNIAKKTFEMLHQMMDIPVSEYISKITGINVVDIYNKNLGRQGGYEINIAGVRYRLGIELIDMNTYVFSWPIQPPIPDQLTQCVGKLVWFLTTMMHTLVVKSPFLSPMIKNLIQNYTIKFDGETSTFYYAYENGIPYESNFRMGIVFTKLQ